MRNIVFVGGIHGVGKTSFSQGLCDATSLKRVTASALINSGETKLVQNVGKNQDILIQAIRSELDQSKNYLMDGHFCLLNSESKVEEIQIDVFQQIGLAGVFILTAAPKIIQERLQARDSKGYSLELLNDFQEAEIAHGKRVGEALNVPLRMVSDAPSSDLAEYIDFTREVLR